MDTVKDKETVEEVVVEEEAAVEVVADAIDAIDAIEAKEKFETDTQDRLEKTFNEESISAEDEDETDDSTPEEKDEIPAETKDDVDASTLKEEVVEKEDEVKATDDDPDKSKTEKDAPPLSDAYYRAAIHMGWKPEDITDFYENNPEMAIITLARNYEAVNRSTNEFASMGRTRKQQAEAAAAASRVKVNADTTLPEPKQIDIKKLRAENPEDPIVEMVDSMQEQNQLLYKALQESKQNAVPVANLQQQQDRAAVQQQAAIEQQIEGFFKGDDIKGYEDFYGTLDDKVPDWKGLAPGFKANRWAVIEMMDNIVAGAQMNGQDIGIEDALRLAHLSVSESVREKVIRNEIKSKVQKRNASITLKPTSTAKQEQTKPQTKEDLEIATHDRLNKVFSN